MVHERFVFVSQCTTYCLSDSIYLLFFFLSSSEQYIMQMYFKHMEFILNRLH